MVANLSARHIDGFCVGEPWGQRAVELGIGRCAVITRDVWRGHPDKVLGVSAEWAARHPIAHRALIAALIEAARWLDEPDNRQEAASLIAGRGYVDLPEEIVAASLIGRVRLSPDDELVAVDDFNVFHRGAANFPWCSHAEWTLAQMRRWGQIGPDVNIRATAEAVYRPDIYREVAAQLGEPCPAERTKTEGRHAQPWPLATASGEIAMSPDLFLDGRTFDPAHLDDYIADLTSQEKDVSGERRNA
jgi:nitrate/nitrite transport system substrate-binding protein